MSEIETGITTWTPDVVVGEWGYPHVFISNVDVTYFRGVPIIIDSWSSGDPFSDASAVFRFPQISSFDYIGIKDLYWLHGHALVEIKVKLGGQTKTLWEGMVASIEDATSENETGLEVQCIGALYQLDYYVRSPMMLTEPRLYEDAIKHEFNRNNRPHLKTRNLQIRYPSGFPKNTGMETRFTGSWDRALTGYVQRLLADMQNDLTAHETYPDQIGRNEVQEIVLAPQSPPAGGYPSRTLSGNWWLTFRGQRTAAIRWDAGASTIKARLEALSNCNGVSVTGSGTASSPWRVTFTGSQVRERSHPRMGMEHHSLRHDHAVTRVTRVVQGRRTTYLPTPHPWEGRFTVLKEPGRRPILQVRDEKTVAYTVTVGAPGVVHDLKRDYSQAPNVIYGEGTDESATTWRNSTIRVFKNGQTKTRHHPVAWDERTHHSIRARHPHGQPTERRPRRYSPSQTRVEILQKFGAGVSLRDARRSAQEQLNRESDPGWLGTITLRSDPEEMSRFEIQAGKNLRLRHFRQMPPPGHECYDAMYAESTGPGVVFTLDIDYNEGFLSRAVYALVMFRLLSNVVGLSIPRTSGDAFNDISSHSRREVINRLAEAGIVHGYADGTFRPDNLITRAQAASMMVRAVKWATGETLPQGRIDYYYDDGPPHEKNINAATEAGLIRGRDPHVYDPQEGITREEIAVDLQQLARYLGSDLLAEKEGIVLHIAEVKIDFQSGTVDLTVDSKARDLRTLAQMIERLKDEERDPAKMLMVNRESSTTDDTKFPWDYEAGSGSIPKRSMVARYGALPKGTPNTQPNWFVRVRGNNHDPYKRWAVIPVVAAGKGSIHRSEIRAYNASGQLLKIPFHVGVYQQFVTAYDMPRNPFEEHALVPDPMNSNAHALTGWHPSAAVLWGQYGQRAGYWPGLESEENPPTGVLIDEGTWQFQIQESVGDNNILYVAIYCEANAYFQGRFYHGVQ